MSNSNIKLNLNRFATEKVIVNIKLFLFILIIISSMRVYVYVSAKVIESASGPNISNQITRQFNNAVKRKYDCLFLGSSEIYYGINPDKLSISSYNFAFGEETFNQEYYKLLYLKKHNVNFKYLVLGLDYSDFSVFQDRKNYVYKSFFDRKYFYDYSSIKSVKELNDYYNNYIYGQYIDKTADFVKVLVTKVYSPKDNGSFKTTYALLKDNGQMIRPNVPELRETRRNVIKDIPKKLEIQEKYFDKILKYTADNNIQLILVVPPKYRSYDKNVIKYYDDLIMDKIKGTNIKYLNYQDLPDFNNHDFYDDAHLTNKGADKFTNILEKYLIRLQTQTRNNSSRYKYKII